jgi:peptidoglycan/LPS O-acetylase OafA/YrhL
MNNTRIDGIDYLRAICSIFVVVWHLNGAGRSLIFSKDRFFEHIFTLSDFVNFHILLLAVPIFIFVSTYLYAIKGPSSSNLLSRFKRICILLLFWPGVLIIFQNGYSGLFKILPNSITSFAVFLLRAGYSLYYFFVSLIICLFLTHLVSQMKRQHQIFGFVLSAILLTIFPEITKHTGVFLFSVYWNPLNFIPFSFAAVLLANNLEYISSRKGRFLIGSIVLCVLFAVLEWKFSIGEIFFLMEGEVGIPTYTRTSLVFAVLAISIIALTINIRSNAVIKYMSRYSLALYCLHAFFMKPTKGLVSKIIQGTIVQNNVSIIIVILLSYLTAMILKNFLKEKVLF